MIKNISTKVLLASLTFFVLFLAVNLAFTRKTLNAFICGKGQVNQLGGWKEMMLKGQMISQVPVVNESFALFAQMSLFVDLHFPPGNEKSDPFIVSKLSLQAPDLLPGFDIPIPGCKVKWVGFHKLKEQKFPQFKNTISAKPLNNDPKHLEAKSSLSKMASKPSENSTDLSEPKKDFTAKELRPDGKMKIELKPVKYEKLTTHDERWEFEKGTIVTDETKSKVFSSSIHALRKSDNKKFVVCEDFETMCHYLGWNVEKKALIFEERSSSRHEFGYVINGSKKHICFQILGPEQLLLEKGWITRTYNPPDNWGDTDLDEEHLLTFSTYKISVIDLFTSREIKILEVPNYLTSKWKSDGTLQYWVVGDKEAKEVKITKEMFEKGNPVNEECKQDRNGPLKEVDLMNPRGKK